MEEQKISVANMWWDRAVSGSLVVMVEFGFYSKPDGSQWTVLTRESQKTGISNSTCPQPSLDLPPNLPLSYLNLQ